jgi:hypothetical protein
MYIAHSSTTHPACAPAYARQWLLTASKGLLAESAIMVVSQRTLCYAEFKWFCAAQHSRSYPDLSGAVIVTSAGGFTLPCTAPQAVAGLPISVKVILLLK